MGSVVVAEHQTAGRGRRDRGWEAPPGTALLASIVLKPSPLLSLAAGVAAARACGDRIRLKWPNDLLLEGRKVGGILIEVHRQRAIVGIGINLSWAPPAGAALGVEREPLLGRLQAELEAWTAAPAAEILSAWRNLSDTLGRSVRVELPSGAIEGVAEDVDLDGALLVSGHRVAAGDVIYLRAREDAAAPRPSGPE